MAADVAARRSCVSCDSKDKDYYGMFEAAFCYNHKLKLEVERPDEKRPNGDISAPLNHIR